MSYFICGTARLVNNLCAAEIRAEEALSTFVQDGEARDLKIQVGPEQMPRYLVELLERQVEFVPEFDVPFLIADPASQDNSEGILFPKGLYFDSKEYREHLLHKLQDIQHVFNSCLKTNAFDEISVIFSSSFEQSDSNESCSIEKVASVAYEKLRVKSWFASFKLTIGKN